MRWETTAATPEDMKKLQQAQRNNKMSE